MTKDSSIKMFSFNVKQLFTNFFLKYNLDDPLFDSILVKTVVDCFHLPNHKIEKEVKAKIILHYLFKQFSFDLMLFVNQISLSDDDQREFFTALLDEIFLGDIKIHQYKFKIPGDSLEFFMYQILAENVSSSSLYRIIENLPLNKQIFLICFAFRHYREGSYILLKQFQENFHQKSYPLLEKMILGLKRKFLDADFLFELLEEYPEVNQKNLAKIVGELEKKALEEVKEFHILLNFLIKSMIVSPTRILAEMEKIQKNGAPNQKKIAEQKSSELRELFKNFLSKSYSLEEMWKFAQIFGLRDHLPNLKYWGKNFNEKTLVGKIRILNEIFQNPIVLIETAAQEIQDFFGFVLTIVLHLESLFLYPMNYTKGLDKLTCVIPTKGKLLSQQPSLISLLEGLNLLVNYLQTQFNDQIRLRDYPIFVYDQSEKPVFENNSQFITDLNQQYNSSIIHLSLQEILFLAQKIKIKDFIDTTKTGSLGYGGARNCCFLLTPILRKAFKMGNRSLHDIMQLDEIVLQQLFQEDVLESPRQIDDNVIFMVDDDMEIPVPNIFSALLYAEKSKDRYSVLMGKSVGRLTKYGLKFPPLNLILRFPKEYFQFSEWRNEPFSALMSEYVSKPRVCLNLPFGGEEDFLEGLYVQGTFQLPSVHLGGTRYPSKELPTHYFIGLDEHLKKYIPYTIHISMMRSLIEPIPEDQPSTLPWNNAETLKEFSCLGDFFNYLSKTTVKKEMQKIFWTKVHRIFDSQTNIVLKFREDLLNLIQLDVDQTIEEFEKDGALNLEEKDSLAKIANIYKFNQIDAKFCWQLALAAIEKSHYQKDQIMKIKEDIEKLNQINFEDYPLTQGLYLTLLAMG